MHLELLHIHIYMAKSTHSSRRHSLQIFCKLVFKIYTIFNEIIPASNPIQMFSLPICFQMYEMIYITIGFFFLMVKKPLCPILWNCNCVSHVIVFILAMTNNGGWVGRKVKFIMERSVKLGYGYTTTVKMDTNSCRRSCCRIYMTNITVIATVIMTTLKRKI